MAVLALATFRNREPRFLEGLAAPELKTILSAAKQQRFLANSVITNQGTPARHFFLLVTGRARYFYNTFDGRKVILKWLPPGEIVGGAALLSRSSDYIVSAEAVKNSSMLIWDRVTIRGLIARYPQLADNAMGIMFDYLILYCAAHISLIHDTARQRLAHALANTAIGIGQRVVGGIELDVQNEELASEANVSPFTASRLLGEWQQQGILTKSRGKVLLRSPEQLFLHEI